MCLRCLRGITKSPPFVFPHNFLQEIEDLNVMHKFDKRLERLAMVMPLTEHFDPGVTHFAHEHLQVCPRRRTITNI